MKHGWNFESRLTVEKCLNYFNSCQVFCYSTCNKKSLHTLDAKLKTLSILSSSKSKVFTFMKPTPTSTLCFIYLDPDWNQETGGLCPGGLWLSVTTSVSFVLLSLLARDNPWSVTRNCWMILMRAIKIYSTFWKRNCLKIVSLTFLYNFQNTFMFNYDKSKYFLEYGQ